MKSLTENWLAIELGSLGEEFDGWSAGLQASFNSLFQADAGFDEDESPVGSDSQPREFELRA